MSSLTFWPTFMLLGTAIREHSKMVRAWENTKRICLGGPLRSRPSKKKRKAHLEVRQEQDGQEDLREHLEGTN